MASSGKNQGLFVLVDEYFDTRDDRFLATFRQITSPKKLAGLVDRMLRDPREWAARQIDEYIALPMNCPGHEVVVKRLFKHAEAAGDDERMAAFLVAFDRLVRRERIRRWQYDYQSRQAYHVESLRTPRNRIPTGGKYEPVQYRDPYTGKVTRIPRHYFHNDANRLFSYHTRYYLRRRAWRYFRRMGYQRPADYPAAVARALARYRDEDLAAGENILDSWGLMQIAFRHHDALAFGVSTVRLQPGRSIGELVPAPRFGDLWKAPEAFAVLLEVLVEAQSRLVRVWATEMLEAHHGEALKALAVEDVLKLLGSANREVQQFGLSRLKECEGVATLGLDAWLGLLEATDPNVNATVCDLMRRHVSPERLDLAQCLRLCLEPMASVAELGLAFLRQKPIATGADREALKSLAGAKSVAVAGLLTEYALGFFGGDDYDREAVVAFFDSLTAPARDAAWQWLTPDSPGWSDPPLWSRLLETPYDNLRMQLVDALRQRANLPGVDTDELTSLWCSVLANIHRGGRSKPHALDQIADAIAEKPERLKSLLPVLRLAVRSVRGPEHRAALAAVASLMDRRGELAQPILGAMPELTIPAGEAIA